MTRDGWLVERLTSYDNEVDALCKKYPNEDIVGVLQSICQLARSFAEQGIAAGDRRFGWQVPGFGGNEVYKFRQPIGGKGKSSSIRFVYALLRDRKRIICLSVYEKPDKEDLIPAEKRILKKTLEKIIKNL